MEKLQIMLPYEGMLLREYLKVVLYYVRLKKTWSGDRIIVEGQDIIGDLSTVLQLAEQKLENAKKERERTRSIDTEIPQSGNDRRKLKLLYEFLKVGETQTAIHDSIRAYRGYVKSIGVEGISTALGGWADGYRGDAQIVALKPIEIFRPERYEYGRSQGYVGKRNKEILLGPNSTVLGLVGYILARQARSIKIDKDNYLASIVIPEDPGIRARVLDTKLYEAHVRGMNGIYSESIPGIASMEALALWLGWLWKDAADLPEELSNITLYLIREPAGRDPAYVRAEHSINIAQFARVAKIIQGLPFKASSDRYQRLIREALISRAKEQPFASKICRLAYLAIIGSIETSELVYVANRESIIGWATQRNKSTVRRIAGGVALDIQRAIETLRRTN